MILLDPSGDCIVKKSNFRLFRQPPFSDGYLSMQPAKRRRVVSANKPSGDLSSVIAETIRVSVQFF